jgi:hypothetical protein
MPFLAPLVPLAIGGLKAAAPALIKTGVSAGVGALGNKLAGRGRTGSASTDSLLTPEIQEFIRRSQTTPALEAAEGYYTRALGGDRQRLQELLGPEIKTVLSQYDTAAQTAAELNPRGGGRTQVMAEIPFQKAAAYGQQLAGARAGAADKLAAIGSGKASREGSLAQTLIGARTGQSQLEFQKQQARNEQLGKIGSAIGDLLVGALGKKKSGTSSVGGYVGNIADLLGGAEYGPGNVSYKP